MRSLWKLRRLVVLSLLAIVIGSMAAPAAQAGGCRRYRRPRATYAYPAYGYGYYAPAPRYGYSSTYYSQYGRGAYSSTWWYYGR